MDVLTTNEAAEMLGYSPWTLRQMRWENRGPLSYKRAGRVVYLKKDLETYLEYERRATTRGQALSDH
ncbi:hypothetical protein BST14_02635 [Mycobacterium arosiense ATCC BAA-1401 = DSM 45069]|uniref:Helix-turn-helix domain-containing protein n=2 Tax=Mycobacterium arosiense TaxID=425468 RepID=A0A1W9ZR98_MYCAI|nr:hypothetical protein BST14_02635 [Mycobacterium arosiense ATCC BAA-1401 = DSM 45069]